jgi:histidine triad (HIT) family protein
MADQQCIFCRIAAKEIPANMIAENEHAAAFLDVQPLAPGHTLVVPKMHVDKLVELPAAGVGPLFTLVQEMAGRLEKGLRPDGLTIGINQGVGQGVPHLHVHLVPRWKTDGGGSIHTIVSNPPKESPEEIAKKLAV